jgi:hypothetical protein
MPQTRTDSSPARGAFYIFSFKSSKINVKSADSHIFTDTYCSVVKDFAASIIQSGTGNERALKADNQMYYKCPLPQTVAAITLP